jgi:hypothetical protein
MNNVTRPAKMGISTRPRGSAGTPAGVLPVGGAGLGGFHFPFREMSGFHEVKVLLRTTPDKPLLTWVSLCISVADFQAQ